MFPGTDNVEAALCFYKALKVYPTPSDLITIYDKTGKSYLSGGAKMRDELGTGGSFEGSTV